MSILVLGSNSFAGSSFVDSALDAGYRVIGISRSDEPLDYYLPYKTNKRIENFTFNSLDLNKDIEKILDIIGTEKPVYILDFAGQGMVAESWENPEQWYQTNIISKIKLHHYLKDCKWLEKYIRVSTPEVYGNCEQPVTESKNYNPSTPYAVTHAAIDMSLMAYHANYSFPVVLTRFANFFGPCQQLYRIIPRTIVFARLGKKLQLHGGGTSVRSFIHSKDVASGLLATIERGKIGDIYHFSDTYFPTIREVVESVCNKMNVIFDDIVEITKDRPGKDRAYLMNSDKAKSELSWKPVYTLESGIEDTISWVDTNLHFIRNDNLDYEHKA